LIGFPCLAVGIGLLLLGLNTEKKFREARKRK